MRLEDVFKIMLPPRINPQTGKMTYPHITFNEDGGSNGFGWRFRNGKWEFHWGVDINYEGGRFCPLNQDFPPVYSPVSGEVIDKNDQWGMLKIKDYEGNRYEIWHLQDLNVRIGDYIHLGDQIGTMGRRGANDYHVDLKIWARSLGLGYEDPVDFYNRMFSQLQEDEFIDWLHRRWNIHMNNAQCPLVLDLDGDGVETTTVANGIYFDHDGNRFAEKTSWAGYDDGILVWDRNNDGIINDGKELFGDQTLLKNGSKASNGFQALADWDDNKDGKIDANDAIWSNLKVWQDYDGDGYSSADGLYTLSDLGISSMSTGRRGISPVNLQHLT